MTKIITSFTQDQKFTTKSERFVAIQPSKIAEVLLDHNFDLVHLKTGKSKNPDRANFQTTTARYRSKDAFEIDGLNLDIIFKVPHLYGALQGVLGLFRGTCANQLNVGKHFEHVKVKHVGNPYDELNSLIPYLVAQRSKLIETVQCMRAREVSQDELRGLARRIAQARLSNSSAEIFNINSDSLLKIRRQDDTKADLFTAFNVIQENIIRHGVSYQTISTDKNGITRSRFLNTKKLNEQSVAAIDLNGTIWDLATDLLTA